MVLNLVKVPMAEGKRNRDIALVRRTINEKWLPIYRGEIKDLSAQNCALCMEYINCNGCPIREDTGKPECHGTPYQKEWTLAGGRNNFANNPKRRLAALQELLYLQTLVNKLVTKRDELRKEAMLQLEEESKKAEETRFYPYMFLFTLKEPVRNPGERLRLLSRVKSVLKREGLRIVLSTYQFQDNLMGFSPRTGQWKRTDQPLLLPE